MIKIGFIGLGHMGTALVEAFIANNVLKPENVSMRIQQNNTAGRYAPADFSYVKRRII